MSIEATAQAHLRADHVVAIYYPVDTIGYLDIGDDGRIGIGATKSGDAGETDEVRCLTCDTVLQLDSSIP